MVLFDIEPATVRLSAPSELEFGSDFELNSTSAPVTLPLTTNVCQRRVHRQEYRHSGTNSYRVVASTAVDQTRSGCPSNRDAVSAGITKDLAAGDIAANTDAVRALTTGKRGGGGITSCSEVVSSLVCVNLRRNALGDPDAVSARAGENGAATQDRERKRVVAKASLNRATTKSQGRKNGVISGRRNNSCIGCPL